MNFLKNSILAGTVALTTSCGSLSDLLHFGDEPALPDASSPLLAEVLRNREARMAQEQARGIAAEVVSDATRSSGRVLAREYGAPYFGLECVALLALQNPEAASCFFTLKQGAGIAFDVRDSFLQVIRDAFGEEQYTIIYRYLLPDFYTAQDARAAALQVKRTFLSFIFDICGDALQRGNIRHFGIDFYYDYYAPLLFNEVSP
ncbi:MAG TPA: hypothetical protein VJC21_04200 [Candidatus Nanoarchaeia archaeon]|nr:hypothetical protein [Candidatus Nanoarchaeia archaeon]